MLGSKFRRQCNECLHNPVGGLAKVVNAIIAMLIIISVAMIPLYLIPDLAWARPQLEAFELFVVVVFIIEYFFRAWSAKHPLQYAFSWYGIIDLAAVLPAMIGLIGIVDPSIILALRLLRILKLGRLYYAERESVGRLIDKVHGSFVAMPDERIEAIVHKHPILYLFALIPLFIFVSIGLFVLVTFQTQPIGLIFAGFCFMLSFFYALKKWLDFNFDVIYITNYRILMQNRQLFGYRIEDIAYPAITSIRPDTTGFIQYLCRFGNIYIETSASAGSDKKFSGISRPLEVVQRISTNRDLALKRGQRT